MKKTLLLSALIALTMQLNAQTVTDFDGNVYNTVVIGTQEWMQENLKSLHYADGTVITGVTAYDNIEANVATYGRLYTWNAAMKNSTIEMSQGVCPDGWHMPNDMEWDTLITFLGGITVAGGKMKESGTTHWTTPNTGGDNSSGFTALPAGFYMDGAGYNLLYQRTKFWTSSQNGSTSAWECTLRYDQASTNGGSSSYTSNAKTLGASIRCLKGNGYVGINESKLPELNVYPNPAFNNIQLKNLNAKEYSVEICDMLGVCVMQKMNRNNDPNIDISQLAKGVYMIKISYNNKILQSKFIKQ